ncbi:MAG: OmpA family protein [Melioribacteraceae bacterium]|nr:OmpA family protein [Melioribacteraceae bacterium]
MIQKIVFTVILFLFVNITFLNAQFFNPTKIIKNTVEEKLEEKLEEGVSNSIDDAFEGKKRKSNKNDGKQTESDSDFYPPDGATDISIPVTFKWNIECPDIDQYGHEFYLHTTSDYGAHMVGGPIKNEFTYSELEPNTTYYWKVVAAGNKGYMPGPSGSFTTGDGSNDESAEQEPKMNVQWSKFDFVPGDEVIFEDAPDIMEENGEFPSRWDLVKGQVEIANVNGENVIMFIDGSPSIIPFLENSKEDYLPEVFTVEFDMYRPGNGNRFQLYLSDMKNQTAMDNQEFEITYNRITTPDGIAVEHPNVDSDMLSKGRWIHISLAYTKGKLKVYMDDSRLINIPRYAKNPTGVTIQAYFADLSENKAFYLKNFRIAKGGVKYYDRVLTDGKIICNGIRFDVNKTTLKPESIGPINKIFELMTKKPEFKFSVEGHTDADGDDAANQTLSEKRAKVVMNQLIKMGIAKDRLKSNGFGESKPLDNNSSPEGKANNRRVEFVKF